MDDFEAKYRKLQASTESRGLLDDERKVSNELYAMKLVERIVFGFVGLALLAIVGAVFALVLK